MRPFLYICLLIFIVLSGTFVMKKNMPYEFDLVPRDSAICIFCTTTWSSNDFIVIIENQKKEKFKKLLSGDKKFVRFDGLENSCGYSVKIYRNDFIGKFRYKSSNFFITPENTFNRYVVLVGASVGKSWNLNELHLRKNTKNNIYFGYRGKYDFDKSDVIHSLISNELKPNAVIIKECAKYFPRDIDSSLKLVDEWVASLKSNGIVPILATVVPVTSEHDKQNDNLMNSINEYNNALRSYSSDKNVSIIDLQSILSDGFEKNYLNPLYASEDGLHLNSMAYSDVLDDFLISFFY